MYILILEDEKRNFNRLKRLLEEIDATHHVAGPLTSIAEAVEWLRMNPAPDLILADIRLTDGLSFDALRQSSVSSPVIFTTAYDEYAIQAFKFNSFDYLLKPVNADELAVAIQKVKRYSSIQQGGNDDIRMLLEHMRKNNYRYRERFLLPYRDGYVSVSVKDISHVALDGRNVCLYMKNGTNEKYRIHLMNWKNNLTPMNFSVSIANLLSV